MRMTIVCNLSTGGKPKLKVRTAKRTDPGLDEVKEAHLQGGLTLANLVDELVVTVNGDAKHVTEIKTVAPAVEEGIVVLHEKDLCVRLPSGKHATVASRHMHPNSPVAHGQLREGMTVRYWIVGLKGDSLAPGSVEAQPLPVDREPAPVSTTTKVKFTLAECSMPEWECPACGRFDRNGYYPKPKDTFEGAQDAKRCDTCKTPRPPLKDAGRWKWDDEVGRYRFHPIPWLCSDCGHPTPCYLELSACQACKADRAPDTETTKWSFVGVRNRWEYIRVQVLVPEITSGEHTGYDALIRHAESDHEKNKGAHDSKCLNCNALPHHDCSTPRTFRQFYRLDEISPFGELRRAVLRYLLGTFSSCTCKLYAIPLPGMNHYGRPCDERLRSQFEAKRSKMQTTLDASSEPQYAIQTNSEPRMLCHIVPLQAGGCPFTTVVDNPNAYNVVPLRFMCNLCQWLDALFTEWQGNADSNALEGMSDLGARAREWFSEFLDRHAGTEKVLAQAREAFTTNFAPTKAEEQGEKKV